MIRSRRDVTMLAAMGVLMLFAVYNFLIRPQGANLSSVRDQRAGVEQQISAAELALLAPLDTSAGQSAAESDPAALTAAVPADPAIAPFLRQLQAIALETGMIHGSIAPTALATNPNGPGGSLQIGITAAGSHESALAYVERLRDLDRLLVVEQIGLVVQPDGTEQLQLAARVFTSLLPVSAVSVVP